MAITPIDTSIQSQAPTTSATIAEIMKSQNLASEIQSRAEQDKLARQQQQQNQMAMEQQQRDQADQQKLSEHFADPTNASRLASGDMSSLYKIGIQPKNVLVLQDHFIKAHKEAALSKADDLKNEIALGDAAAQGIEGLKTIPDLNDRRSQLPGMLARWRQLGIQPPPGLDLNSLDVSDAGLQKLAVQAGVGKGVAAAALKIQQDQATLGKTTAETEASQAKTSESEALAGLHKAQTPGAQAKSDIEAAQAAAIGKMTPETIDATIDSVIAPGGETAGLNARTKALAKQAVQAGMPLSAVQAVIKDASDQIGRTETAVATAKATAPIKVDIHNKEQADNRAARTPDQQTLDFMAEKVLAGEPPASRDAVANAAVFKRAAEIAESRGMTAQAAVLASHSAKANTQALNAVTKQYETLKPFAEMAEKNADILEKASKNVTDLGASFLNTPVRELEAKFGGTKTAAFRAALLPVQADFARILNSPTGAGQLTDSARKEMEHAIGPGATPGQITAALDVFRQDARNRKESYEAAIKDLTGRTVSRGNLPADIPPPPPPPPNQNFRREYNGHVYTRQTEKDPWTLVTK